MKNSIKFVLGCVFVLGLVQGCREEAAPSVDSGVSVKPEVSVDVLVSDSKPEVSVVDAHVSDVVVPSDAPVVVVDANHVSDAKAHKPDVKEKHDAK